MIDGLSMTPNVCRSPRRPRGEVQQPPGFVRLTSVVNKARRIRIVGKSLEHQAVDRDPLAAGQRGFNGSSDQLVAEGDGLATYVDQAMLLTFDKAVFDILHQSCRLNQQDSLGNHREHLQQLMSGGRQLPHPGHDGILN